MTIIYNSLLQVLKPFVKWWGELHTPFSKKLVQGKHYYKVRNEINVGTVLLTTTYGEFSNLINPEKIKHAGIYVGRIHGDDICYVLEALGKGVVLTDLVTFMTTKDLVIGCKPNFLIERDKRELPKEAKKIVGVPYDFLFNDDVKHLYCFEAAAHLLNSVRPEIPLKCREIIKGKSIYSYETFLNDKELFTVVFNSSEV